MKKECSQQRAEEGMGESPHETARWAGGRDGTRWGQVDSDMKALVPLWRFRQGRQRTVLLGKRRGLSGAECGVPPALGPGGFGASEEGSRCHCQHKPRGTGFLHDVNLKVTQIPGFLSRAFQGSVFCPFPWIPLGSCDIPSLEHLEG